jgi:ATP-dependent DNA ligase
VVARWGSRRSDRAAPHSILREGGRARPGACIVTRSGSPLTPCLPTNASAPPFGKLWLHEVKHDGFRVIARKIGNRVRLYSRPGNDPTWRFRLIVEAVAELRSPSCIIDGEAVACGEDRLSSFDRIRYRHHDAREGECELGTLAIGKRCQERISATGWAW